MLTEKKWNFKVVFNRSCCHGNYENVNFYLLIKIFHQYIFHLPSFSLWAATFLLPWFGKWHNHKLTKLCSATLTAVPKASKKRAQSPPPVPPSTFKKSKYTGSFLYKTHFSNTWTQQWPCIVAIPGTPTKFRCTACNRALSCAKQGIKDVKDHLETKAHQNNAKQLQKQPTLFQTIAFTQNDIDKVPELCLYMYM